MDGMTVEALGAYLKEHRLAIPAQLLEASYKPRPLRRVEIPKPSGGMSPLGNPTLLVRFIQQAMMQVLQADLGRRRLSAGALGRLAPRPPRHDDCFAGLANGNISCQPHAREQTIAVSR